MFRRFVRFNPSFGAVVTTPKLQSGLFVFVYGVKLSLMFTYGGDLMDGFCLTGDLRKGSNWTYSDCFLSSLSEMGALFARKSNAPGSLNPGIQGRTVFFSNHNHFCCNNHIENRYLLFSRYV